MQINGWRYYNHAAMPSVPPHEQIDDTPLVNGQIWRIHSGTLLARWVTDWDSTVPTNWWYIIKDTRFDMSSLKSKRRYEINKGVNFFQVFMINPKDYKEEIYQIQIEAYADYPEKYRPNVDKEKLFKEIDNWEFYRFYGAFHKETGELCGYAWLNRNDIYIYYAFHKVKPVYEKNGINAAIVAYILKDHEEELMSGVYICDGSRSVSHETNFQNYLEKYFGFRKAYCTLHIKYRTGFGIVIKCLFPFRRILRKMDNVSFIHNINSILLMEEIKSNTFKSVESGE